MRCSSAILAIVVASACCAAAWPQPAHALSARDLRVEQNVQLLKGYIDTQAAQNSFTYPARSSVRKGGGLVAPIWPTDPFSGAPMASGTWAGHYTYTPAADRHSYTLVGHLSGGHRYTVRGASPTWLAGERAQAASDLQAAQDALSAADSQVTNLQGELSTADDQVTSLRGQLATAQAQVTTVSDEAVKLGTEYIASVVDVYALQNADTFPSSVATQSALTDQSGGALYDYWPVNPWTGVAMKDSTVEGDYTYSIPSENGYLITGHLSSGGFGYDGGYSMTPVFTSTNPAFTAAFNNEDRAAEAGCQVVKDYVDEWALTHSDALPTVDQLSSAGAVGQAHTWWPTNPFLGLGMSSGAGIGQYTYTPGDDGFTVTVKLVATTQYPATYTAQ
jgi:hypothetical protein